MSDGIGCMSMALASWGLDQRGADFFFGLLPHFLWCFRLPSLRVDFWDCLAPSPLPTSCGVFEGKLLGHSSSFPSSCGGLDYSL